MSRILRVLGEGALAVILLGLLIVLAAVLEKPRRVRLDGTASVHDGDTIRLGDERIRLRGIDAPELKQICRRNASDYPCGRRSQEALLAMTKGRRVACTGGRRDKYRRLVGDCRADGIDLSRALIEQGWAVAYGRDFAAEEGLAQRKKVGLWAGDFEKPRDWRIRHGEIADFDALDGVWLFNWLRAKLGLSDTAVGTSPEG